MATREDAAPGRDDIAVGVQLETGRRAAPMSNALVLAARVGGPSQNVVRIPPATM
jgi:hypothetical protein